MDLKQLRLELQTRIFFGLKLYMGTGTGKIPDSEENKGSFIQDIRFLYITFYTSGRGRLNF